ncbi:MAG: hypothetical protein EA355_08305, partial [Rhodobacteraceae bacterium]
MARRCCWPCSAPLSCRGPNRARWRSRRSNWCRVSTSTPRCRARPRRRRAPRRRRRRRVRPRRRRR